MNTRTEFADHLVNKSRTTENMPWTGKSSVKFDHNSVDHRSVKCGLIVNSNYLHNTEVQRCIRCQYQRNNSWPRCLRTEPWGRWKSLLLCPCQPWPQRLQTTLDQHPQPEKTAMRPRRRETQSEGCVKTGRLFVNKAGRTTLPKNTGLSHRSRSSGSART